MRNAIKLFSAALLVCAAIGCYASSHDGQDCEGCSDHALSARYPGSILLGADQKAYDEAVLVAGPATRSETGKRVAPKTLNVAGKRTRLFYMAPASRSALEVFANYREALEKAGMKVVWTCSNDQECGPEFLNQAQAVMQIKLTNTPEASLGLVLAERPRYLLATLARPEGDVHVTVLAADITDKQRPGVYVIQVEAKPMDKGMAGTKQSEPPIVIPPTVPAVVESKPVEQAVVPVDAAALNTNLANTGQVTLYGIHFDFDKADIKPESKPQIDEIGKVLSANPALKLRVTGYTDSMGSAEHNQGLSQRRADAIIAALVANYAIAADRLTASGLGATAPVASNDTEEGRAKNRRVELLKQ